MFRDDGIAEILQLSAEGFNALDLLDGDRSMMISERFMMPPAEWLP